MNDILELFRAKIYSECGILVNDLSDVIKEVTLFAYEKIIPFIKENEEHNKLIFDGIEVSFENERDVWRGHEKDSLCDPKDKEIKLNEINEFFGCKEEFLKDLKEKYEIDNFPKDLYGKAFMCLAETISILLYQEELFDNINVFDIFILNNNGINNVIYEIQ